MGVFNNNFVYKSIIPANEEEWKEIRNQKITATISRWAVENFCIHPEIKKIATDCEKEQYNQSKWGFITERLLDKEEKEEYYKLDKIENASKYKAFEFGKEKEASIGNIGFEELKKNFPATYSKATLKANGNEFFYIENQYVGATPDFIITQEDDTKTILECKTASIRSFNEKLIEKYSFQVQCQMLCTGIDNAFIIFAIKDINKNIIDYKLHKVESNLLFQKYILQASNDCYKWFMECKNGNCDYGFPITKQDFLFQKAKENIKNIRELKGLSIKSEKKIINW